jgi:hypothetical protein
MTFGFDPTIVKDGDTRRQRFLCHPTLKERRIW